MTIMFEKEFRQVFKVGFITSVHWLEEGKKDNMSAWITQN